MASALGHEAVCAAQGSHGAGRRSLAGPADVQADASQPGVSRDLIKQLGNFVPQSPKDVTVMQRRLIRAGIRNENALKILYGAKVAIRHHASACWS